MVALTGCATGHQRPCTEGGQAPRDSLVPFKGTKRCFQVKDSSGNDVNEGKYLEWYPNEKIAIIGEYHLGKKIGRWLEYDPQGNKVSDKFYEDGKEIARP